MKFKTLSWFASGLMLVFGSLLSQTASAEPTVDEIVANANRASYYQGRDGRAQVRMLITDSQGRKRRRQFTILRKDIEPDGDTSDKVCKDQNFYVYFHSPTDMKKTVFMVHKHVDRDDDRWLYLPALDLVKRIAASDERTSFVGSDFFYEDVSGRGVEEDTHTLVETTDNYFVLKNVPKKPESVEFAHYKVWIHRETYLPTKTEYFDKSGKKYREYTALKVETIDGYPTVTRSQMKDLRTGSTSAMAYSAVSYNIDLPEDIFAERYLRNAPTEYLK